MGLITYRLPGIWRFWSVPLPYLKRREVVSDTAVIDPGARGFEPSYWREVSDWCPVPDAASIE